MENPARTTRNFKLKPIVSAITIAFGSAALADEPVNLPRVEVQAQEAGSYKVDQSANRKFTADLIDTPKSVTVIPEQVLRDSGVTSLTDALRMTPGITLGAGEGGIAIGDRPFIRGFDAFNSIYIDGLRDVGAQTRETFAVEQIEVLKGPSGAFDGRGSAGGSINMVTKQARQGNFINGSVGFGTDSYQRATVDANTMLGDNAAARVVGLFHDADVAGRDGVELERWGIMPSITLGLNSPTTFTASWYHFETDDTPDWGIPFVNTGPQGYPDGRPVGSKDAWYGVKGRDFMETEADIVTIGVSHAFNDNVTLSNTTRYGLTTNEYFITRPNITNRPGHTSHTPPGMVDRGTTRNRGNRTESIMNLTDLSFAFDTGTVKHNVNTGFEISREENRQRGFSGGEIIGDGLTPIGDPDNNVGFDDSITRNALTSQEAEAVNKSIYIFDSMELSEKWLLNAGLRYDHYRTEVQNRANDGTITNLDHKSNFFNWQLGVVYKLRPDLNLYAMHATSSSPVGTWDFGYGGGNLTPQSEDLSPERTRTYEIGTKWNVTNNFELTAALFHTVKSNMRVTMTAADGEFANAGEAEVNGFELGFAGNLTDRWSLFGGYTYVDAEQTKAGTGTNPNNIGAADSKGKQLWGTPEHSASLWTTYRLLDQLTVGGGMFYTDKVYADPSNNGYVPSYVRWDAMAKYDINSNFDVQLNVQNLTDERYFSTTYFRHFAIPAQGRSAFVTLNFKY